MTKFKLLILLLFSTLGSNLVYSQNPKSYFLENEVGLSIPAEGKSSLDVGVGSRGMLQETFDGEKIFGYQHEHLELNLFTNYATSKSTIFSLGLRYRFTDIFDSSETDEFRIIEQLELEPVNLSFSHRFRLEQRFRENIIHRIRYELAYSAPINQYLSFGIETEALYAISSQLKPEAEQRFSIGLENSSLKNIELELGFEYRMEDYAGDLAHEFFIVTGINYALQSKQF
ncbi:DUF2490 domain-containing protein [Salinimicrobium sediminilitoris]|uniref:DUF2490 domain-containing protein n=1 Tax=Salinimicrobium sediminilitoris TaxID=2876715 RepID=UPI001E42E0A8|nr:DUF2490 domain-containing protein [Salinimicrobium sediminilitoris]MCC8360403.1 DUF2490 domain-containing protein [Salinimicrobium sediminilitoris]